MPITDAPALADIVPTDVPTAPSAETLAGSRVISHDLPNPLTEWGLRCEHPRYRTETAHYWTVPQAGLHRR